MAPVNYGRRTQMTPHQKACETRNTDLIASLLIEPQQGNTVLSAYITPMEWEGTHVQTLGRAFQRYRFKKLQYKILPRCPTTAQGGYIAGSSSDATFYPTSPQSLRALKGSTSASIWQNTSFDIPCDGKWRWTNFRGQLDDENLVYAGGFHFCVDQPPANLTAPIFVNVEVSYVIEFCDPQAEEKEAVTTQNVYIGYLKQFGADSKTWLYGVVVPEGERITLNKRYQCPEGFVISAGTAEAPVPEEIFFIEFVDRVVDQFSGGFNYVAKLYTQDNRVTYPYAGVTFEFGQFISLVPVNSARVMLPHF